MSGDSLYLLAAGPPPPPNKPLLSVELWVTVGLLSGVLLGGAFVLYLADRWRKRQATLDREATESLTSFRSMYERGEISEEEYRQIRTRIAARVRREVAGANPSLASGAVPANPGDDPNPGGLSGEATGLPPVPPTG